MELYLTIEWTKELPIRFAFVKRVSIWVSMDGFHIILKMLPTFLNLGSVACMLEVQRRLI